MARLVLFFIFGSICITTQAQGGIDWIYLWNKDADFTLEAYKRNNDSTYRYYDGSSHHSKDQWKCKFKQPSYSPCQGMDVSAHHDSSSCPPWVKTVSGFYTTVLIGGQCWMNQNLKEPPGSYRLTDINVHNNIWFGESREDMGYWGFYNPSSLVGEKYWEDLPPSDDAGLLYQWSAAMNGMHEERSQGVCPPGWHIPSDCEWMHLEYHSGMQTEELFLCNEFRESGNLGSKWITKGTNDSLSRGFQAILVGCRNWSGTFSYWGNYTGWWSSSSKSHSQAFIRSLSTENKGVRREAIIKSNALSVRCIKD